MPVTAFTMEGFTKGSTYDGVALNPEALRHQYVLRVVDDSYLHTEIAVHQPVALNYDVRHLIIVRQFRVLETPDNAHWRMSTVTTELPHIVVFYPVPLPYDADTA